MSAANIMAALEAQSEILDNAKAVKGPEFVAKARIAYAAANLNAIAQHMATCNNPKCCAGMALMSDIFATAISKALAEGLSKEDQNEIANLCRRMSEQAQAAQKD